MARKKQIDYGALAMNIKAGLEIASNSGSVIFRDSIPEGWKQQKAFFNGYEHAIRHVYSVFGLIDPKDPQQVQAFKDAIETYAGRGLLSRLQKKD